MNLGEQGKSVFLIINQITVTNILNTREASSGHTGRTHAGQSHLFSGIFPTLSLPRWTEGHVEDISTGRSKW